MIKRKAKRRSSELAELDRASVKSSSAFRNWKPLSNAPPRRPACGWTATQCLRPTASGKATRTALCAPVVAATAAPRTCARELRENFMLLGLLICAIAASFCWIIRLLEQQ